MKIKIISFLLMLCIGIFVVPQKTDAQVVSVNFQVFYDELSPYGVWIDNPDYGFVWVPNVDSGFTPYATRGYWVFTDEGWTWVSDYPWGWATFHYGRWYIDASYGPVWVPDNEWSPGWVTWRKSSGYYGWAPIGPGINISATYDTSYKVPLHHWTLVRDRDFGRTDINNHYVNSSDKITIINNSTVINNTRVDKARNVTYNGGPDRMEVERSAGKAITPLAIKESNRPGQYFQSKDELQLYRPEVQKIITTGTKPAPSKVVNMNDVKPASQRSAETAPQKANPPANQQSSPPQQANPSKNSGEEKQPQQINQPTKPSKKMKKGKQPRKAKPSGNTKGNNQLFDNV